MIKRLQHWLADFKVKQTLRKQYDGFGWAMSAYYLEDYSVGEILAYIEGGNQPFDHGARDAVHIINERINHAQGT